MKHIFLVLFLLSCAQQPAQPSTHCYLYAGMYLLVGDIEQAFYLADQEVSNWPPYRGSVYLIVTPDISIENPTEQDFDICETMACTIDYKITETDYHCMVFEYETGLLYDNGHCRFGCRENHEVWFLHATFIN